MSFVYSDFIKIIGGKIMRLLSVCGKKEKALRILVYAATLGIFLGALLVGCDNAAGPTDSTDPYANIGIEEITPANIADSGATEFPDTEDEITSLIIELGSNGTGGEPDPFLASIIAAFEASSSADDSSKSISKSIANSRALFYARTLSESFNTQIEDLQEAFNNFPQTKRISKNLDLSGEDINETLHLTKGEAYISLTAKTSDEAAIADDGSNLESVSGQGIVNIQIDPIVNALPLSGSFIQDIKLRLAAGVTGSVTSKLVNAQRELDKITLDYYEEFSIALSLNNGTQGGKIIIREQAEFDGEISAEQISAGDEAAIAEALLPSITISVKVYDDSNAVKFENSYTSVDGFIEAYEPDAET